MSPPTTSLRRWAAPLGLFLLALAIRGLAAALLPAPPTEGSAWYADVAQAIATGRGAVADATWSYATPPLVLPKPAFELWMPLASLVALPAIALLGPSWAAVQAAGVLVGACAAPLAWAVGRDAAARAGLPARRVGAVAVASGLLVACLAPLVLAAAAPESTNVFLVAGLCVALCVPRALAPSGRGLRGRLPGLGLGMALGACWLARQEAIWLGAVVLLLVVGRAARAEGRRGRHGLALLAPVVVGGLVVVVPWLVRQAGAFGGPFPGQASENLWLVTNPQIFAWAERPEAAAYLARGPAALAADRVRALGAQLTDVLLLPAFPVGVAGLAAVVGMRRSPAIRSASPLAVLLLGGGLTFVATALLVPVAPLWGTFLHASGPLLAGLAVVAALGGDALLARVSRRRGWARENVVLAPAALVVCAVALLALQLAAERTRVATASARLVAIAAELDARGAEAILIADQPVRLADATGRFSVVLPDEPGDAVLDLARHYGTRTVVILGERGRYPDAFLTGPERACLAGPPERIGPTEAPAWLLRLGEACAAG
ncbi:MAG: hypothetical protein ACKOTZ_03410 [Chloroflexota bacterium]